MQKRDSAFLFEVGWEVCNKVGGIYTVLQSKAATAVEAFGDNYYLLGPDLRTNAEFEETDEECWIRIREAVAIKEIPCRFGRWRIPGDPKVILLNPGKKYNKDQLLFSLWEDYGVDSIAGHWDYIEPVMFSYACGEVIETVYNLLAAPQDARATAQFHEWMCGAGLLRIKKAVPEIGTVFTTHATILGRTLAGAGRDIYSEIEHVSPQREAVTFNISAKHSMEAATAREADVFTTVSEITAAEARALLGRNPEVILPTSRKTRRPRSSRGGSCSTSPPRFWARRSRPTPASWSSPAAMSSTTRGSMFFWKPSSVSSATCARTSVFSRYAS